MRRLLSLDNIFKAFSKPSLALEFLKSRLKADCGYRFGNGYSFTPGKVFFALTSRCNLKCSMCPQNNHPSFKDQMHKDREATFNEWRKVVDEIAQFSPMTFVSGGEPFLHPSGIEFLSHIKSKGLFCATGTNGTMLEKYSEAIVEMGLDNISVSLDGSPEIHDQIRGIPGTYEKAVAGLKRVMDIRNQRGSEKPETTVIFTITPENYRNLPQMVESTAAMGVDCLRIGHLNFMGPGEFDSQLKLFENLFDIQTDTSWEGFVQEQVDIDGEALAGIIDSIEQMENKPPRVVVFPNFTRDEVIRYYTKKPFKSDSFKDMCLVPWDTAIIGPSTEMILCPNYVVGKIREEGFKTLWNNNKSRRFRKVLKEKKLFPACGRGCCFFYT